MEKDSLSKEGKIYLGSIHKKKLTHTFTLCNVKVNSSEVYFMALKDYKMIHRFEREKKKFKKKKKTKEYSYKIFVFKEVDLYLLI